MNLDRALIKSQAKQLIKGKVWTLFLITLVVGLLTAGAYSASSTGKAVDELKDNGTFDKFSGSSSSSSGGDLEHYFDGLDDYYGDGNSGGNSNPNANGNSGGSSGKSSSNKLSPRSVRNIVLEQVSRGLWLVNIICAPLSIALCGVYLMLVKGNPLNVSKEFSYTFKNTFSKGYFNRFLLIFFQILFTSLWSLLFVIPGIVYSYKIYFAQYIQIEYPELSWKECLDTSKKLTNGHKGELFALDLSYIPWLLLTILTCGLVQIYVAPYYSAVKALYYENFKQRALQTNEVTPADFMSEEQRYIQYINNPQMNNAQGQQPVYYNPPINYNNYNQYNQVDPYAQNQQNYFNNNEYAVKPPEPYVQDEGKPVSHETEQARAQAQSTAEQNDFTEQAAQAEAQDTAVQAQAQVQEDIPAGEHISDNDTGNTAQSDGQNSDLADNPDDSFSDGENKEF